MAKRWKEIRLKLFIHGVADTAAVWTKVLAALPEVQTEALCLPGFGVSLPKDFHADKESYVNWLIEEMRGFAEPVDLVGHDWGAMFALRAASLQPKLVRSLAVGNGPISEKYEWHRLAKIWQQDGEGEQFMQALTAPRFAEMLISLGVSEDDARHTAERLDAHMKQAILTLYRSAVHVGNEWAPDLSAIQCHALIYWGSQDQECPVIYAHEMANRIRQSQVLELDCGHWVPLQAPFDLASALRAFWK